MFDLSHIFLPVIFLMLLPASHSEMRISVPLHDGTLVVSSNFSPLLSLAIFFSDWLILIPEHTAPCLIVSFPQFGTRSQILFP